MYLGKLDRIRITPRKMGMVADQIRGKSVYDAYRYLQFSPRKKTANVILGVLQNALANDGLKLSGEEQYREYLICRVLVGPGRTIKRFIPRAKGSGSRLLKRTCHLKLFIIHIPTFEKSYLEEHAHVHGPDCQHGHTVSEMAEVN